MHTLSCAGMAVGDELTSDNVCSGHAVSPPPQHVRLTWCLSSQVSVASWFLQIPCRQGPRGTLDLLPPTEGCP